jgi:uncharacterized membrane protein
MKETVSERIQTSVSVNETGKQNGRPASSPAASEDLSSNEQITPNPVAAPLHMTSTEFTTAMVHFYRGEVQRSNTWRNRLDTTTNWAVLTTGATLSFVFSSPTNPPFVIPINSILVAIFMFMEARRYRYYEVWAGRVRVLETGYFAPMLSARSTPTDKEWAEHLSADLMSPHFTISEWEAVGRRLRSNYIWIFILLALSYNLKVYLHPFPAPNFDTFIDRAQVGLIPGWIVVFVGVFFNALLFLLAVFTLRLKEAKSEVLPHSELNWHPLRRMSDWTRNAVAIRRHKQESPTTRRAKRARQRVRQTATDIHKTEPPGKTSTVER